MLPIALVIHGAAGRMGQRIVALAHADRGFRIAAAIEAERHPELGRDAGIVAGIGEIGVPLGTQFPPGADVVIDFSTPSASLDVVRRCRDEGIPLVLATTGLNSAQEEAVRLAARAIPLLWSPSMSVAVNLTMKLTEIAARALAAHPTGVDVEIVERHHRFKEDAPSGTALRFGQIVATEMGQTRHQHGRAGRPGIRPRDEIAYHAVRAGDNPGEHAIIFGLLGETIELTVRATSRDCYAQGALAAARFLMGKPAGLYGMQDVLGL